VGLGPAAKRTDVLNCGDRSLHLILLAGVKGTGRAVRLEKGVFYEGAALKVKPWPGARAQDEGMDRLAVQTGAKDS